MTMLYSSRPIKSDFDFSCARIGKRIRCIALPSHDFCKSNPQSLALVVGSVYTIRAIMAQGVLLHSADTPNNKIAKEEPFPFSLFICTS
jgi:hypothetical protein